MYFPYSVRGTEPTPLDQVSRLFRRDDPHALTDIFNKNVESNECPSPQRPLSSYDESFDLEVGRVDEPHALTDIFKKIKGHFNFIDVDKNRKAEKLYERAKLCQHCVGTDRDSKEALRLYKRAADRGHLKALYDLAKCYEYGWLDVNQDPKEALRLYKLAADHGHPEALHELALCYKHGWLGVDKDLKEAIRLFERAIEQGNDFDALISLANLYEKDLGNSAEAKRLYKQFHDSLASLPQGSTGSPLSCKSQSCSPSSSPPPRPRLIEDSHESDSEYSHPEPIDDSDSEGAGNIENDVRIAESWKKKIAEGNVEALDRLATSYRWGIGVDKNLPEAIRLYRLAADQGYSDASQGLIHIADDYREGESLEKNLEEAARLYRLAANYKPVRIRALNGLEKCYAQGVKKPEEESSSCTLM